MRVTPIGESKLDHLQTLQKIWQEVQQLTNQGKVADYIPELAKVPPHKFGICLEFQDGSTFSLGDSSERFSIQSISKVYTLTLAIARMGEQVWERVGVEPSGTPFNSLIQLELEAGIPRNPFINAGALVICDILLSIYPKPFETVLDFVQSTAQSPSIQSNPQVAASEKVSGFRNTALANFLKDFNNLQHDTETVLDLYYRICAIEMSCEELARSFLFYSCHGYSPFDYSFITKSEIKRLNAVMQTCGFYDEAGEFAYRVGLPGKSGVGGGIAAIHPNHFSVAVWSPRLNPKGNSVMGMKALELLTTKLGLSIF